MTAEDKITFYSIGQTIFNFFNAKPNRLTFKAFKGSLLFTCTAFMDSGGVSVGFNESLTDYEKATIEFYKTSRQLIPSIRIESSRFKNSAQNDMKMTLRLRPKSFDIDMYYKYYHYLLQLNGSSTRNVSLSAVYDIYNDNKVLFGARIDQQQVSQIKLEYTNNTNKLAIQSSNNLNEYMI
eukprot:367276_1